ncbi:tetratricopeptide repeat protein [Roseateles amylovorans]|uniref:Tetratricopeptide repeat protein n=1 Tax=Roseateles amylovorans TaxID=2978473 RepID=A0ABY6B992_9BURK|nr:tetratricopeptide repeat protein [Roseateles amylovorans]UXH80481.1 tetratricopeptide repeat protein [Roseateles amylovorans]
MSPAPPDAGLELAWRQIERRMSQLQRFGLLVVFVKEQRLVAELRQRVRDWALRRVAERMDPPRRMAPTGLDVGALDVGALQAAKTAAEIQAELASDADATLAAATPGPVVEIAELEVDDFAVHTLQALYERLDEAAPSLLWLEAHRGAGQPAWEAQRARLLSRLNEQRSRLEAEMTGPFLLLLPDGGQREASSQAPDLWHARYLTVTLGSSEEALAQMAQLAQSGLQPPSVPAAGALAHAVTSHDAHDWLTRWNATIGDRPATVEDARGGRGSDVWLPDALSAARDAIQNGEVADAEALARRLVSLADARRAAGDDGIGGVGAAQSLSVSRDLALALQTLGYALWTRQAWDEALAHYRQAIDVARAARQAFPRDKEPVLLLAMLLDDLSMLLQRSQDFDGALSASEESLALRRKLLDQQRDAAHLRHGLVTALESLGLLHQRRGHLARADACLTEALSLARVMVAADPALAGARSDLAEILLHLGFVKLLQGDADQAMACQQESVELRRLLMEEDLSLESDMRLMTGLEALAVVAAAQGDERRATRVSDEALAIARARLRLDGPTRLSLDNLGTRLMNRLGSSLPAEPSLRDEAVRVYTELSERFPDIPAYSMHLATLRDGPAPQPLFSDSSNATSS